MGHYVGKLLSVVVVDEQGETREIPVAPVALCVDPDSGLETSPDKGAAKRGEYYISKDAQMWFPLHQVVYYRKRPEGDHWYHDVNGHCALVQNGGRKLFALLHVPDARRCAMPGDFICGG